MSGVIDDEIEKLNLENMEDSNIMEYLKKKLMRTMNDNGNRNKVIPLDQVEEYVLNGWEYVNELPNDRVIMKLPMN